MDNTELSRIKENLQTQLSEVESLQSVFYNPGEIKVEDPSVLHDITNFISDISPHLPQYIDLVITLTIENLKFQLCVSLSHDYPHTEPEIFVRNHKLNRNQHVKLNRNLQDYVNSLEKGEPCIFSALSWLQDNAYDYVDDVKEDVSQGNSKKNEKYVRYWIYSHHIYSKTKRKEIVDLAHQLHIRGFCMPGKPGIICVEGTSTDCNEWWQSIKSMNWKKIFCKVMEEDREDLGETFMKFNEFTEVVFANSGMKFNHMDMGELLKYLEAHQLGMLMPKKNRIAIYEYLFKEGVMVAKKDYHAPKHPELETIPNLEVIKALQSLKSRGFVKEQFAWRHYYWYLTNAGIEYLRTYLHLPPEIVPSTLKRPARSETTRPRATALRSETSKPSEDRAGYRRTTGGPGLDKKADVGPGTGDVEFRQGFGRGRPT